MIDLPVFTVPVARFVKSEVDKRPLEIAPVDQYRRTSNDAVLGHRTKAKDKFPLQNIDSVISRAL